MNDCKINTETLIAVLIKMLDTQVIRAEYKTTQLHGDTGRYAITYKRYLHP